MRVLQFAKRSIVTLAAVSISLAGCGGGSPEVPFNPTGTSADVAAVNAAFGSSTFQSFSSLSVLFDAALGGSPIVSASVAALSSRPTSSAAEIRADALKSARRLAGILPRAKNGSFSASSAAIVPAVAGKTFVYSTADGAYVVSDLTGAPSNGVRFLLYAVNPITRVPVEPLNVVGQVELTDLSGGITHAARIVVVSDNTTYLDYTVSAAVSGEVGRVTVDGFATDGANRANFNLRSTLNSAGLSLVYTLNVPQRDVSIDLTLTTTGLDQQNGNITIDLSMHGPNGTLGMTGQFTASGGTLTVQINGNLFATITSTVGADPVITGSNGQVLTQDDIDALGGVFEVTGGAFSSFDHLLAPVGAFFDTPA